MQVELYLNQRLVSDLHPRGEYKQIAFVIVLSLKTTATI